MSSYWPKLPTVFTRGAPAARPFDEESSAEASYSLPPSPQILPVGSPLLPPAMSPCPSVPGSRTPSRPASRAGCPDIDLSSFEIIEKTFEEAGAAPGILRPLPRTLTFDSPGADFSPQFMLLSQAPFTPEQLEQLRGKTVVFVRGYLSHLYRAVAGSYLDHHAQYCRDLGMKVIMGDVGGCGNATRNSLSLYRQIISQTTEDESVIIVAHSYGTLASLDMLQSPAFANVHSRIDGFIPINGPFRGTPLADLLRNIPVLGRWLHFTIGRAMQLWGGDEDTLLDMTQSRRMAYIESNHDNIVAMIDRLTVVPVVSSYSFPGRLSDYAGVGMLVPQLYMALLFRQTSDGAVPCQSQVLPGAGIITLRNLHHAETIDDLGRFRPEDMMRGILGVCLQAMPPERRWRGVQMPASSLYPPLLPPPYAPASLEKSPS